MPEPTPAALYIARLRSSFFFFVQEVWKAVGNDAHTPLGDIEEDVCNWVQHGPPLRGVLAWRLFSKTTIVSCAYALWLLFNDPNHKVMVLSKSGGKAREFLFLARRWIDIVPFLNHLAPSSREVSRDSAYGFDVAGCKPAKDPSFVAKGIDGQITGSRAHTLIPDDIEDKDNTITVQGRQRLLAQTDEFSAIVYDGGSIVPVGTFHNEDSVYFPLSSRITFRTWPVLYPSPGQEFLNLAPIIKDRLAAGTHQPGDIVAPYRVTREWVNRQRATGERYFALQFMLQSNLRAVNRYPLKLSDLIVFDTPSAGGKGPLRIGWGLHDHNGSTAIPESELPLAGFSSDRLHRPVFVDPPAEWVPFQSTALAIDPGGSGTSSTGVSVGSALNGTLFLHDNVALTGAAANINTIARLARTHHATTAFLEGNLSGAFTTESNAFAGLLQAALTALMVPPGSDPALPNGWACKVEVIRSSGQKEIRIIDTLEPLFSNHRLVLSRKAASNTRLQHQIAHLTSQRHCLKDYDDIDSLSILARHLAHTHAINPDQGAQALQHQHLMKALRQHQRHQHHHEPAFIRV